MNRTHTLAVLALLAAPMLGACGGGEGVAAPPPETVTVEVPTTTTATVPAAAPPTSTEPSLNGLEVAWQAALEAELGHPVPDWSEYYDSTIDDCVSSERDLQLLSAMFADNGGFDAFRIGIEYACPDRLPDVDAAKD